MNLRWIVFHIGVVLGAIVGGVICGLFPLATALKRDRTKPGLIAFGVCVIASCLGGADLAWLAAFGGIVAILVFTKRPPEEQVLRELTDRIKLMRGE